MSNPFLDGAKNLIQRFSLRGARQTTSAPPAASAHYAEGAAPPGRADLAIAQAHIETQTRVVQFAAVAMLSLAGLFFAVASIQSRQPTQAIYSEGELTDQVRNHLQPEGKVSRDDVALYLHSLLTLKFTVTRNGAPFLPLLQGLMSAKLYQDTTAAMARNIAAVKAQDMAQTFVLDDITLDYDKPTRLLIAIVQGHLEIQATTTKRGVPLAMTTPYRAKAIIEVLPPSDLNLYSFFLVDLPEYFGRADAEKFDREMEASRARITGKT